MVLSFALLYGVDMDLLWVSTFSTQCAQRLAEFCYSFLMDPCQMTLSFCAFLH